MRPSAPAATPARAIGTTQLRCPVAWEESTIIGKCHTCLTTGIALKSKVIRILPSLVRMPRAHKLMLGLPWAAIYSAAMNHSSIVAARSRLSRTGFFVAPTAFSHSKFCILRANLHHVFPFGSVFQTFGVDCLGHHHQSKLLPRFIQYLQPVDSQSLITIGRSPRLIGSGLASAGS